MLIAGHRRAEAARRAGLETVPALQLEGDLSDNARLVVALVENLLREDLDPIDEATTYNTMRDHGWNLTQIAERVGYKKNHISRRCGLLELPAAIQDKIRQRRIEVRHADHLVQAARKGTHPRTLVRLAKRDRAETVQFLKTQQLEKERVLKEEELRADGVTVVSFDELTRDQFLHRHEDIIDPVAHRSEPCHVVAVTKDPKPELKLIIVWDACADLTRHRPAREKYDQDQADAARQAKAERSKERQKKLAEIHKPLVQLGRRLRRLDGHVATATAVRLLAYGFLREPPVGDELLPWEVNYRQWGCPFDVIDTATNADLARAVIRQFVEVSQKEKAWLDPEEDVRIRGILSEVLDLIPEES